jgi:hypothetical protein
MRRSFDAGQNLLGWAAVDESDRLRIAEHRMAALPPESRVVAGKCRNI